MINIKELENPDNFKRFDVVSLKGLQGIVNDMTRACVLNDIDPGSVPVIVKDDSNIESYLLSSVGLSMGQPCILSLQFYGYNATKIDYFTGKDSSPETGGEYWEPGNPGTMDISGFVVSKEAGERLLQMVKKVLGREECKTWLDWRKQEPNWIQFKLSSEEFDIDKLYEIASKEGILTEEILKICKL